MSFKPYAHFTDLNPMTAALLDALSVVIAEGGTRPERVEITLAPSHAGKLTQAWPPRDAKAAQRSPHWIAACLLAAPDLPGPQDPLLTLLRFDARRIEALTPLAERVSWQAGAIAEDAACIVTLGLGDGRLHRVGAKGYPGDGRDSRLRWSSAAIGRRLTAIGRGSAAVAGLWADASDTGRDAQALRALLPGTG